MRKILQRRNSIFHFAAFLFSLQIDFLEKELIKLPTSKLHSVMMNLLGRPRLLLQVVR